MKLKRLLLRVRVNKKNGQLNVNLPKKKFSTEELDSIQKNKSIKFLVENNE